MKPINQKRIEILKKIITSGIVDPEQKQFITKLVWDCNEPVIAISDQDMLAVLQRFLDSRISALQVYDWAEFLEMREDVDFESGDDCVSKEVMHALATPEIYGTLNPTKAENFIKKIQSVQ